MNNMQDKQEPQGLTVFSLPAMNVPSEDWLGAFYCPTDTLCIRVFADKKGSDYFGQKITCVLEEFRIKPKRDKNTVDLLNSWSAKEQQIMMM
jgi:hypothetical protein